MKARDETQVADVQQNRATFLARQGIEMNETTLVRMTYDSNNYLRYETLTSDDMGDGMTRPPTFKSDGLVVTEPGHALFLPLADCIGAVIHDPVKNIMMLSHLGRHNLEQFGATQSIKYLIKEHGVNPGDLTIWLSPAASKEHYPLYSFDNRSLHDVATEQFMAAGAMKENIEVSPIDSAADENYYSHSQFLKGNRSNDGRFVVVAMMNT
ncbi:MAG: Protein of hypothetical function [Candidatus Saccharibacteria bacterium]|nr:Protein of hypothetical function [Candidatus Saccharibacteria bacterium]